MGEENEKFINNSDDYLSIVPIGSNKEEQISWQVLQAFYNHITAKTESLINKLDLPIQINIENIHQLNTKICQISEQYTIKALNCSISVFHVGDSRADFSSFERFKLYDTSINSPVEQIEIKYEILKVLPNVQKPQKYTISIVLTSGIVAESNINEIRKKLPNGFKALIGYYTATIKINYIDYVVAKNYEHTIDEWLKSCSVYSLSKPVLTLKKYSEQLRVILKYIFFLSVIYFLTRLIPYFVTGHDLKTLALFSIYASLAAFFAYNIGDFLSYQVRTSLTKISNLSFIHLNIGDKKLINEAKENKKNNIIKGIGAFILELLSPILSTILSRFF